VKKFKKPIKGETQQMYHGNPEMIAAQIAESLLAANRQLADDWLAAKPKFNPWDLDEILELVTAYAKNSTMPQSYLDALMPYKAFIKEEIWQRITTNVKVFQSALYQQILLRRIIELAQQEGLLEAAEAELLAHLMQGSEFALCGEWFSCFLQPSSTELDEVVNLLQADKYIHLDRLYAAGHCLAWTLVAGSCTIADRYESGEVVRLAGEIPAKLCRPNEPHDGKAMWYLYSKYEDESYHELYTEKDERSGGYYVLDPDLDLPLLNEWLAKLRAMDSEQAKGLAVRKLKKKRQADRFSYDLTHIKGRTLAHLAAAAENWDYTLRVVASDFLQ
jgi:hypothetical protein